MKLIRCLTSTLDLKNQFTSLTNFRTVHSDWGKRLSATQICFSSDKMSWITFYLGQNTTSGTDNLSFGSWCSKYSDTDTFLFSFGSLNTETSATGMMILFYHILEVLAFPVPPVQKTSPSTLHAWLVPILGGRTVVVWMFRCEHLLR